MKSPVLLIMIVLAVLCAGCVQNSGAAISIENPWARAAKMPGDTAESDMGMNGAAYMVIVNIGNRGDRLLRAESTVSRAVELHMSDMQDGVMRMRPVEFVDVPPETQVELKPGGLHIMLIDLNETLAEGDFVDITLVFEETGAIQVQAEVRAP